MPNPTTTQPYPAQREQLPTPPAAKVIEERLENIEALLQAIFNQMQRGIETQDVATITKEPPPSLNTFE